MNGIKSTRNPKKCTNGMEITGTALAWGGQRAQLQSQNGQNGGTIRIAEFVNSKETGNSQLMPLEMVKG